MSSKIRSIATSYSGRIAVAAEFEHVVHVWNLASGKKICQFESIFEFGGNRLVVSEDGRLCAAGAYKVHGIGMYNAAEGELLWQRKDLKKVQNLTFSKWFGSSIVACFDNKPCHVLNATTGKTLYQIKRVKDFYESPFGKVQLRGATKNFDIVDFEKQTVLGKIPKHRFAILDATFSKDYLVISEATGSVRCYGITDGGKQLWQYVPELGNHILKLEYCEATNEVIGVNWPYEKGGVKKMVAMDINNGQITRENLIIGSPSEVAFAIRGSRLVTSYGEVLNTTNGKTIVNISFPKN